MDGLPSTATSEGWPVTADRYETPHPCTELGYELVWLLRELSGYDIHQATYSQEPNMPFRIVNAFVMRGTNRTTNSPNAGL